MKKLGYSLPHPRLLQPVQPKKIKQDLPKT